MASTYPDETAYRNLGDGSSITFGHWETESNRLAHGLRATGVRKGDLVAIALEAEQILDFIVSYSAVHKIGAVAVPVNNRLSPPEMLSILEHAEVTAVVYRNPEATARAWEGGWLHTGDLGRLDAEGYLYIVGRKKEMVVRGGMNIYADDVEAVLQAHPDVVEAAVVGIPHEVLGEDIAAYVVLRAGATVSTTELQTFAGERLADYKVPRRINYLPALPRNPGGKVLKSRLDATKDRRASAGPQI